MLQINTRHNAVVCRHMRYLPTNLTVSTCNTRSRGTLISGNQFNQLANRLTSIIGALMICAICDIKIHTAKLLIYYSCPTIETRRRKILLLYSKSIHVRLNQ